MKVKVTQSCPTLRPHGLYSPRNSPGQNTGVGSLSLPQGIFPTQGMNPGLPHYRRILHQLSHKGSPRIPEWVAYPFSRGSSQPRNRARVSCTAGGSSPTEPPGKPNWRKTIKSFILKFLSLTNSLSRLKSFKKGKFFTLFLRDCPIFEITSQYNACLFSLHTFGLVTNWMVTIRLGILLKISEPCSCCWLFICVV